MKTTQGASVIDYITELEKKYDFSDYLINWIDEEKLWNCETWNEVVEYLEEMNEDRELTTCEVIYYSNAINYLQENDPSLQESLGIASDYGYSLEDINSELLASLLKTEEVEEQRSDFLSEVEEYVDELLA